MSLYRLNDAIWRTRAWGAEGMVYDQAPTSLFTAKTRLRWSSIALLLVSGSCAAALTACTTNNGKSTAAATPTPALDPAAASPAEGVSSDGRSYQTVAAPGRTADVATGSAGSGEIPPTTESPDTLKALLNLAPISTTFGIENVIGTDDRRKVANTSTYPERAQVLIALPGGRCSGALIGKDLVITAGHCVHGGGAGGQWMGSATIYPARNGATSPYGACTARRFYSVLGWTRDNNPQYDFGAIKLDCDVGQRTGWMGFFWQSQSLVGKSARISSYPGDKPLEQWTHTDQVRSDNLLQTNYFTDTMPGNSGSGVFAVADAPAGCNGPCVHSVHTYGNAQFNTGTRITQPLFDNLMRWRAEPK